MKKIIYLALIFFISELSFSQNYYIVFAANLNSSGGVHREDASGADLYYCKYNSITKTISDLTGLTTDTSAIEWFPSLSPDCKWIAYNSTKNNVHEIKLINRTTKEITSIYSGGRYPEWIDNSKLLISNIKPGKKGIYQLDLDLNGTKPALLSEKSITDSIKCPGTSEQSDAYPFPDYKKIAFHSIKSGQYVSAVSVINTDGTGFENLTNWEGVGHVIVNSTGDELIYSGASNGIPIVMKLPSKTKVALSLPKTGNEMSPYGNPFNGYPGVHWTYPAWGTSSRSLVFSAQAANASGQYEKSRLYIVDFDTDWKNPGITDFSTLIETASGKSGKEFCTASIRAVPFVLTDKTVIHVNLVSHNVNAEDNPAYPDYLSDTAAFWKQRSDVVELAKMCKDEGVKYNYETDWNFLMALDRYDKPMPQSNNKTLLRYITEDLGFEVDGSLHGSKYNNADLVYLFNKSGITRNSTIGGFIASPPDSFQFDTYKNGITSKLDPSFKWYPEILHAPATYKHINEDQIAFSGIWKPKGKTEFTVHDNNGPLTCVGIYNGEADGLRDLLVKQENNQLLPGKIYTQTVFLSQNNLNLDTYRKMIRSFSKYVSEGKMKWVGIRELVEIWKTDYNSEPNQFLFDAKAPALLTDSAVNISSSGATLKGSCIAKSGNYSLSFEYGPTPSMGSETAATPSSASGLTPINCSAQLNALTAGTKYYYRIKASGGGAVYIGLITEFTTSAAQLSAPTLLSPENNMTNALLKPKLTWAAVSGASSYNLQLSLTPGNWSTPVVNINNITTPEITLSDPLQANKSYFWRVQAQSASVSGPWSEIRKFTTTATNSVERTGNDIPNEFSLMQNYPNPFNPETKIRFSLNKAEHVSLIIFDVLGREVETLISKPLDPGKYEKTWNTKNLASGIYFYKLKTASNVITKKMILSR